MSLLEKVPKGRKDHREGCNPFLKIKELQESPERATDQKGLFKVDSQLNFRKLV